MSTPGAARETLSFQTEVKQLLKLMIHSLYSHREIFLRELISNASDAADKLRFRALADPALLGDDAELKITVDYDAKAATLSVTDNGIGLSRAEAVDQLGTIARSGTAEFFTRLTGDERKDSQLIGQFGVGFYSAFIVADRVEVFSRKAGSTPEEGVRWESSGEGEFTVDTLTLPARGTRVVLHLREEAHEFADGYRLRTLIRRYSDHIALPIRMRKEDHDSQLEDRNAESEGKIVAPDGKSPAQSAAGKPQEYETINHAQALWTRPRTDLKDEDYHEFYKHISHDSADPLAWSHNKVEGKREYTSLLYIPAHAPFDLWQREAPRGLKLYVRRVFIMDDAEQFLPLYLRFVKGVIDSSDLPLNVSRELLQQDAEIDGMRAALTRRILDLLAKLAKDEPEKYRSFWREFGRVIKEGLVEDPANRERITKLLRFATTYRAPGQEADREEQDQSLEDYVGRMVSGQDRIYYVTAATFNAARSSPHLELLRRKGVEALLLYDRVDEWVMGQLAQFEGKKFQDVARGDQPLGALLTELDKQAREADLKESKTLLRRVKEALGERVNEVRVSSRLTDSPSCLVLDEQQVSAQLRRILEAAGQAPPVSKPLLELNVQHPLVKYLDTVVDTERFNELALLLFDQATLAEGEQLADPADFVRRLNQLLLKFGTMQP